MKPMMALLVEADGIADYAATSRPSGCKYCVLEAATRIQIDVPADEAWGRRATPSAAVTIRIGL